MSRSFGITLVAAALFAFVALAPDSAFAHGPGGGGGHWAGGGHFHRGYGFGIAVPYFYAPDYYYPDYYGPYYYGPGYGPGCVRVRQHVHTKHGWRWRLVTVCH